MLKFFCCQKLHYQIGNDTCGASTKLQKTKIVFFYDLLSAEKINFTQKSKSLLYAPSVGVMPSILIRFSLPVYCPEYFCQVK